MLASITTSPDWLPDTLARSEGDTWRAEVANELLPLPRCHREGWISGSSSQAWDAAVLYAWAAGHTVMHRVQWPQVNTTDAPSVAEDAVFALAPYAAGFMASSMPWHGSTSDFGRVFEVYPMGYRDRINELRALAEEEEIRPDHRSLGHFARFVESLGFPLRTGALFLLNDGTYAAVWRDDRWRLNLSFRVDGSIDYVLLDRKSEQPSGETGRVDLEGFSELRDRFGLAPLLRA